MTTLPTNLFARARLDTHVAPRRDAPITTATAIRVATLTQVSAPLQTALFVLITTRVVASALGRRTRMETERARCVRIDRWQGIIQTERPILKTALLVTSATEAVAQAMEHASPIALRVQAAPLQPTIGAPTTTTR